LRGQPELLSDTLDSLQLGLLIATMVMFLLMTVFFQSFRVSVTILAVIPAVIAGSLLLLLITGNTLNIQSYMGCIMAIGVGIANAVLFITTAEVKRKKGDIKTAYLEASENRFRPILMTSLAMIAGMIPMAMGLGKGANQNTPLAIAVIGGLVFSAISILFFLPQIYHYAIGKRTYRSASLDPDDPDSKNYNEQ